MGGRSLVIFVQGLVIIHVVKYRIHAVKCWLFLFLVYLTPEMEYCASGASMLAEEIWQIAEGFVEVPVNL